MLKGSLHCILTIKFFSNIALNQENLKYIYFQNIMLSTLTTIQTRNKNLEKLLKQLENLNLQPQTAVVYGILSTKFDWFLQGL